MRALPLFLVCVSLLGCRTPLGSPDASEEFDGGIELDSGVGTTDAGAVDAGVDAGARDAGTLDAGAPDAGTLDAGRSDAGGLPPAPLVPTDASITIEDAGYAEVNFLGRDPMVMLPALALDGGWVIAVSPQSLVVAEGSSCRRSLGGRPTCDFRWISPGGATLATVRNASGGSHVRGEVVMLFRDHQTDCADPFIANRSLTSSIPSVVDLETGATRLSWPRTESGALREVMIEGDLIPDPNGERSCDAGAPIGFNPLTTYTRVRPPYQKLVGRSAHELRSERLLLIDGGYEVARIEADGGTSTVVNSGPAARVEVQLDTFTLQVGNQFYRGAIDGGPLRPIATLTSEFLNFEGGRFASVTEIPGTPERRVIDTEGVMPDLRYPVDGSLLQRAPVLYGVDAASRLVVARVDQGVAATLPFLVTPSLFTSSRFPHDDAALVIDRDDVAWLIESSGVKRVTDHAVHIPLRGYLTPPDAPNVLLLVRRPVTGGPLELLAVDRQTRRLVWLSDRAFINLGPIFLAGCDVPGRLTPGSGFFYFAEASLQPGQLDLFLVRSDLSQPPRRVGTTLESTCMPPVVSRDGTRVAVQETLGGPVTVSVGTW
ncbi:MAG: hypothetical protein Q8K32_12650 [Archangium sp.]|nr:hypothetical protein [Archangium sp.]